MTTAGGTKTCTKCGQTKLITAFHFLNGPANPGQERRRRSDCKVCHAETMREYREKRIRKEGEDYLEAERERVREYGGTTPQADTRRAVERARHRALRSLKDRHPGEYSELEMEFRRLEGVA
jgi:hypothetical protein